MNCFVLISTLILVVNPVLANQEGRRQESNQNSKQVKQGFKPTLKEGGQFEKSVFDVVPLNTPVTDGLARFAIKEPSGFEIKEVKIKIHSARELVLKDKNYSVAKLLQNNKQKELHIDVKDYSPGFYRLYVKVKTKKDKDQEHQYRSAYIDFARFVVEPKKSEVPMPDPVQNNATVGGIDSDNDGIRDDVQIWINNTFGEQPEVGLAVKQMASTFQSLLTTIENKDESIGAARKFLDSTTCLDGLVGLKMEMTMRRMVKDQYLNTKDRLYAEIRANGNFRGQSFNVIIDSNKKKSLCSFDLPNK
ncbi:MAG: hypothetical protein NDI69_09445 [Bacteriovoracaceae bacterium]|nr:hypothetical protein [Bacteriovoracaceae bacterium]